ncbi:hypothetical protein G7062_06450 [Erysipelothrix sp. HDW6C]|uniref:hypothetical protein n=1 Tax=Erysipelothrix sp. HDW6C TaxID=2714930 RepID=UPI00140B4A16|nr:hypothetical protein [Erysipelothrix sp. HDW6C]QIK69948.1 hypothetical protein G7062_06450 [Erysipelothrix sp. HDW6C]
MKLRILAKNYNVVFKDSIDLSSEHDENAIIYGRCNVLINEISINNELDVQELRITLMHEVLHAIYDQFDDALFYDEEHISKLSVALTQILIDNNQFRSLYIESKHTHSLKD